MIPKSICSVIEFQCLIAFLSFHESFFPTTIRQWSRNSGGDFPLEFCLGGLRCLNIEHIPLQHRQAHDLDVNFFKLRKGFQTQIWDPGVPICRFANGGIRLLIDHISGSRFMISLGLDDEPVALPQSLEEEMNSVIQRGLWFLAYWMITIHRWPPNFQDEASKSIPLRIQEWRIPAEYLSDFNLVLITMVITRGGGSSCRSEPYASLRSVKRQKQLDPKHSEIAAVVRSDCETMAAGFNMDYGDYRGDGEAVLYPRLLVIVEVMERLFLYPRLFGF
ncbi:unnamed protein product [Arabidopsis lyrata]|nr:unnamed protein product [Arabidopsis lyrata]